MSERTTITVVVETTEEGVPVRRCTFMQRETWERDPDPARRHLCRTIDLLIEQVDQQTRDMRRCAYLPPDDAA